MNLIINYISKMFKHSFLFMCFYIILRFIIIRRNKKINVKREVLLYVFFLFLLGLYTVAITGNFSIKNVRIDEINIIPFKIVKDVYISHNLDKNVILIGFLISLSIEFTQLFLKRTTDIDDLILNTLGVIIGLLISKRIKNKR